MKKEFFIGQSMLDVQRYLRRINARLIRMKPINLEKGDVGYIVLYI
jgi:hypothetical protein